MKSCIAVLTRGYTDINSYSQLIKRNTHIDSHLIDKTIDILIFHEGNIIQEHQIYIKEQTPLLNIFFLNISSNAFKKEKEQVPFYNGTHSFGIGYRHMCSFWFVDFWNFVEEYDFLLRIDEDCFINSNIDDIFEKLNSYFFICGCMDNDEDFVTIGLNNFTLEFIKNNSENYSFKQNGSKRPGGPYTNLIGFSLNKLKKNEILKKYIENVDTSNMIYERRWGDLPLWGEVIYYIFENNTNFVDNTIKYIHGSHGNRQIN